MLQFFLQASFGLIFIVILYSRYRYLHFIEVKKKRKKISLSYKDLKLQYQDLKQIFSDIQSVGLFLSSFSR